MKTFDPTASQQQVIDSRGKNLLVSASAGTGKTATMIERIATMLTHDKVDVNEIVVVTFTNLAAAEMKSRLAANLSQVRNNARIAEQLDRLDNAAICTLHSFCGDLLRNYFYVVDIDPAFAILDNITVAALRKNALNDLFTEYFQKDDRVFGEVYKIFSAHRQEDNFRDTILRLYNFSRCMVDFNQWYLSKRASFVSPDVDDALIKVILEDVDGFLRYQAKNYERLAERAQEEGLKYSEVFATNAKALRSIPTNDLQSAFDALFTFKLQPLPAKKRNETLPEFEQSIREHAAQLKKDLDRRLKKYSSLYRGERAETLFNEMKMSVEHVDKLVELVNRFEELFGEEKRNRGGLDFNDLEHYTLRLLNDPEALADIRNRYKWIFVDEYQDTNYVQEAIIEKLATTDNLFTVGDVKQSIYGFRGCEPSIFVKRQNSYAPTGDGVVVELNDNFRSNSDILNFVNDVFEGLMTEDFGQVNYVRDARLQGGKTTTLSLKKSAAAKNGQVEKNNDAPPQSDDKTERAEVCEKPLPVTINLLVKPKKEKEELSAIYDITAEPEPEPLSQGALIAEEIKRYCGTKVQIKDKDGNTEKEIEIGYGDIVILMRAMTGRATEIYKALIEANIPVAASFKQNGYSSKEVRDIINLLRVVDNPYNDMYMVGAALVFGELSENDLATIRLHTAERISFYERLQKYAAESNELAKKVREFLEFSDKIRFYSHGATVCETVLQIVKSKNYELSVQSLPNGGLRLNKLYNFIDSLKDASYAQSVDKFLSYVDETDESDADVQNVPNAVRMMTMHASKGLEFPVVIVAGLESGFNFDRYAVKTNSDLGIAVDYYDCDSMRKAETIGAFACDLANKKRQREEEMRLLYVALTRAKYALDLVATVDEDKINALPTQPTRASGHWDWIQNALHDKFAGLKSANGVAINVISDIKKSENGQERLCKQTVGPKEVLQKISYAYPYRAETLMPSKVVSSALDGEFIERDDAQPNYVINRDSDRNEVGTAYHKVYQYIPLEADKESIRECISALVNDHKLEERFADKLDVELIYNTLHSPAFKTLFDGGEVYHEIPFMLYAPRSELFLSDMTSADEVMLQGVIDLLILGKDKATVVDFKYTGRSDQVTERYKAQLNSYRLAVQRICGVQNVECYILSIADNKLIKMS